jgi:thiamine-phosphate pyrophosphorylase
VIERSQAYPTGDDSLRSRSCSRCASRFSAAKRFARLGVPDFEPMPSNDLGAERRARLAAARLYMVCASAPAPHELPDLLRAAVAGGVEVVQLRDKYISDDELAAVAKAARILCEQLGVLFVVNDRPLVAIEADADGVHVGQDDMPAADVRELAGPEMLVGLSTHTPEQIDTTDPALVDYIGVGPIHRTPTKPGRPAVGPELVRYAAGHAALPFFAIGGLDAGNLGGVIEAGATRACVLRAIAEAEDPERAARELSEQLASAVAPGTPG